MRTPDVDRPDVERPPGRPAPVGISELAAVRLVATRELTETLRRKAVWITAALFLLASSAAMILPEVLGGDGDTRYTVGVTGPVPVAVSDAWMTLADATDASLELEHDTAPAIGVDQVEEGDIDAWVRLDVDPPAISVSGEQQVLVAIIQEGLRVGNTVTRLGDAGLDEATIAQALAPTAAVVEVIDADQGARQGVAAIAGIVTYLLLLLLAMQIANGVAIEKSSRVSEVLLAIVPARALLFGKVIGIGLIGALTVAAGAAPIVVRLVAGGSMPPGTQTTLVVAAIHAILGVALYLCLAGSLAALVERTEDVGSSIGPLTSILIVGYIVAQFTSDGPLGLVLAYLPLTSPMVMPARVALGEASVFDLAISIGLLVVAVVLAARFATAVYRRAIVRTGTKLKLTDLRAG